MSASSIEHTLPFRTPPTADGPFYPPQPIPPRWDLTQGGRAQGEPIVLFGVVSDHQGTPVANAVVEIWQADNRGYYDHPRARGTDPLDPFWRIERSDLDPAFEYFGAVNTDAEGVFAFRTVRPGGYHVLGTDRAPHIHVKVRSVDHGVLTTQVYFPSGDDARQRRSDRVYQGHLQPKDLIVEIVDRQDAPSGVPDVTPATYCRRDLHFL